MFIYFEREWGGQREGERESQGGSALSTRARCGAQSHHSEVITCTDTKSWTLNRLSHPGAPVLIIFYVKTRLLEMTY